MRELVGALADLWVAGGFVMPGLVGCAVLLWYQLAWRTLTLRRGDRRPIEALLRAAEAGRPLGRPGILTDGAGAIVAARRDPSLRSPAAHAEALHPQRAALGQGRAAVRSVVAIAPLLGLLGTVTGMIETFDSLGEMQLFTQGGGIAGGIGEALLTTQMGLAVAVPGIVLGRLLDRREATLTDELDRLVELARPRPAREAA